MPIENALVHRRSSDSPETLARETVTAISEA